MGSRHLSHATKFVKSSSTYDAFEIQCDADANCDEVAASGVRSASCAMRDVRCAMRNAQLTWRKVGVAHMRAHAADSQAMTTKLVPCRRSRVGSIDSFDDFRHAEVRRHVFRAAIWLPTILRASDVAVGASGGGSRGTSRV